MGKVNKIATFTIYLLLGLSIIATTATKKRRKNTSSLVDLLSPPNEVHKKQDPAQQCCDSYCCSFCEETTTTEPTTRTTTADPPTTEYSCPDQYRCDDCYPHTEPPYCPDQGRCQECWPDTTPYPVTCPEHTCPSITCPTTTDCICTTSDPCPTPSQEPCPSCPTTPPPTTAVPTGGTTCPPSRFANPQFTKTIYQSSLPTWPLAGTTVHLGIHANTTDGSPLRYQLVTTFEFLTLSASQDIIFTSNVGDGAFVGPNNVMVIEVSALVIGDEDRASNAAVVLVFPRSTKELTGDDI
ncbi:hypothetical protein Ocin01_06687 [Orchesella cincta]|uniref:Uncharacterized protein n=1 Tax=Orchesella cincta TaxID=48709 RepID=A0A1D2N3Y6_ORCCI|nr:hypothetical protein Ocin01_06687 [Orchesella cincta]